VHHIVSLSAFAFVIAAAGGSVPVVLAQVQIEQRTVLRVRAVSAPESLGPPDKIHWDEKKGPKCVQMNALAGALVSSPTSIDLILRGGLRMRAKLEKSCPSIDFYSGFYVRPSKDGRICEDRDLIHARTGGECEIDSFRTLVPGK
jgi:hypothetical protein